MPLVKQFKNQSQELVIPLKKFGISFVNVETNLKMIFHIS